MTPTIGLDEADDADDHNEDDISRPVNEGKVASGDIRAF